MKKTKRNEIRCEKKIMKKVEEETKIGQEKKMKKKFIETILKKQ